MLNGIDKLESMHKTIKKEVQMIPRGDKIQNRFRYLYYNYRMKSLRKKAKYKESNMEVFLRCLSEIREEYPDFTPKVGGIFKKELMKHDGKW
ncbi:hypothetical protein KKE60_08935 [Patescibacteria group bacterium]|nr:hypothetical protein [Patescibacteria group bacterium]